MAVGSQGVTHLCLVMDREQRLVEKTEGLLQNAGREVSHILIELVSNTRQGLT